MLTPKDQITYYRNLIVQLTLGNQLFNLYKRVSNHKLLLNMKELQALLREPRLHRLNSILTIRNCHLQGHLNARV